MVQLKYIDTASGATCPVDRPLWRAESGAYLDLSEAPGIGRDDIDSSERSLWRYAAAIGVERSTAVSLGEGLTPLLPASWDGVAVAMKLEFVMPTGSFKDRGASVLVSYLKSRGVTHVLEDSSGNAGAALATYAAAAGMRCRILVPETASYPKIAQIAASGAEVITVRGTRQDVAEAALQMSRGIFYASHNWQPFFLEGTKTLAYELWEQLGFRAPDNIVVPVGYGANVLGCWRGFEELLRRGAIARMPKLFGVQAANCAPLATAFAAGGEIAAPVDARPTLAEGIASSRPTRGREVLAAVRGSSGSLLAVSEEEIVAALGACARKGFYVEPTSAAAGAGLTRLIAQGTIACGETTVVVLTGSGLKAGETIGKALGLAAGR